MRYLQLLGKNTGETLRQYDALSHRLLTQAGFIDQVAAGIFNFLPLGKRVLTKIEAIVREEINKLGAQEVMMPLLQPKSLWETSGRWNTVDVLYKIKSSHGQEYGLGPTHEEIVTPLVKKFVRSYRDLPLFLYHITQKFRDEPRPKSGILRGREFGMKDLYSFHENQADLQAFYAKVSAAYLTIFKRCGLAEVKITEASGGSFTKKYSHEFNVITPAGEVELIYCDQCSFAQNTEIATVKTGGQCPKCKKGVLMLNTAIEVGNIFDLGQRFSQSFDLWFTDKEGEKQLPVMGCYGIGTTRLLGAVVEVNHDGKGIIWPSAVSPYRCHLLNLSPEKEKYSDAVYRTLVAHRCEVLYDDRCHVSAGEKLMLADLIGIPVRLVISERTGKEVEWKDRTDKKTTLLSVTAAVEKLTL